MARAALAEAAGPPSRYGLGYDASTLAQRGYVRLPEKLPDALQRFRANPVVTGWFPDGFADVYVKHKAREIEFLGDKGEAEICAAYEAVY